MQYGVVQFVNNSNSCEKQRLSGRTLRWVFLVVSVLAVCLQQGTLDKLMEKLQAHLPQATSSSPGQKSVLEFTYSDSPPHWYAKLPSAYCNEELGQSQFMLIIIDALEHGSGVQARNLWANHQSSFTHPCNM